MFWQLWSGFSGRRSRPQEARDARRGQKGWRRSRHKRRVKERQEERVWGGAAAKGRGKRWRDAREEGGAAARKQAEPQAAVSLFLLGAISFFAPPRHPLYCSVCEETASGRFDSEAENKNIIATLSSFVRAFHAHHNPPVCMGSTWVLCTLFEAPLIITKPVTFIFYIKMPENQSSSTFCPFAP